MLKNKVIINSSPLIVTVNSGLSFIWENLFEEILIPNAVFDELTQVSHSDTVSKWIQDFKKIKRVTVNPSSEILEWNLGKGETAVLSYCYQNKEYTAIVDDLSAKKCAISFNLSVLSTGSLLIVSKELGLIKSVKEALHKLKSNGMWISESVIELLSKNAGE